MSTATELASDAAVDALIAQHRRLADTLASVWIKNRPWRKHVLEEIKAAALVGLWEAAKRFDPSLGFKFSTFACRRINGAMTDWEREEFGRANSKRSLNRARTFDSAEVMDRRLNALADKRCALRELANRSVLHNAIRSLNKKEKLIVLLRVDGMTMREISESIGVSESRVSQIMSQVPERIAAALCTV